jgi:hypothetical protein
MGSYVVYKKCIKGTDNLEVLRFHVLTVVSMNMTVFWDTAPCGLTLIKGMIEAVHTSETSVYFNETTCHIQDAMFFIWMFLCPFVAMFHLRKFCAI